MSALGVYGHDFQLGVRAYWDGVEKCPEGVNSLEWNCGFQWAKNLHTRPDEFSLPCNWPGDDKGRL